MKEACLHGKIRCVNKCEECEYYEMALQHRPRVLIIASSADLQSKLDRHLQEITERVRYAENEYQCSIAIGSFRPDYVIIDYRLGGERCKELAMNIRKDSRIPFARLVFVGRPQEFPEECEHLAFVFVTKPTDSRALASLIKQL